ncbi:MAG: NUDIX hydrolase [Eubacterium sp.]|nr:NUDIX hydrolase [Eubacterium sp.]MDD7208861.1 NUDIX hydrolase [Lachnospiraceae bacterium]MDY5498131.1 NUDIX hydrolase [Anaerobutyricum sp.]
MADGKKIPVLNSMEKSRDTKFLKSYTLNYTNTEGHEKVYEMVSNFDYDNPKEIGLKASGVVIVGYRGEELLLLKEFRMGVNRFIYNLPAGHLEKGESVERCAERELKEETGLRIKKIEKILPPSYAAPDLSDSSAWVVLAQVEGEFCPQAEEDECIMPLFADIEKLEKLLEEERFSGRAQLFAYFFSLFGSRLFDGE